MRSTWKAGVGQLAWLWLRNQPDSALSAWYRDRVGDGKGRIKRIAITVLARKLLVALWRFVTHGLVPTGAALKPSQGGLTEKARNPIRGSASG